MLYGGVPLARLRENLTLYRTFFAATLAVLAGVLFNFFICGPKYLRLSGDAYVKVYRYVRYY